ncbi:MAG: hypothetical protein LBE20_01080 [Deltaproteobacteria bacterium]|jgi:hypothetical protein|nr:hypothetical protein [Deltaproteobacteria bacterium]
MSSANPLKKIRKNAKPEQASKQVFYANTKYLKNISRNDHARPTLGPLIFVALVILLIFCVDGIFYLKKIVEWLTPVWEFILGVLTV